MRTNERGYLQAIGFQDPDRDTDLHDHICLYLAQEEKARKLLDLFGPREDWIEISGECSKIITANMVRGPVTSWNNKAPIAAIDVAIYGDYPGPSGDRSDVIRTLWVEVKSRRQKIGEILQQLNFYKGLCWENMVLATAYYFGEREKEVLHAAGYKTIFVSPEDVAAFMKKDVPTTLAPHF